MTAPDLATGQDDAAYRRGTVLGLTVAEVFILLLFLLLIALLAATRAWESEREADRERLEKTKNELERATKRMDQWREVMDEFKEPEAVEALRLRNEEAAREIEQLQHNTQALREAFGAEGDAVESAVRQAEEERRRADAQGERAAEAERRLELFKAKGANPPCWYRELADGREKPYYSLNAAIFDDHMVLAPEPPPPGGATDDGGATYGEEAKQLPFAAIPYGEPLDDAAVRRHLHPISRAGKQGRVRTYECIFWIRVWDKTSPDAKRRWKSAHDGVLEGMFGTYTVSDDPWPGG